MIIQIDKKTRIKIDSYQSTVQYEKIVKEKVQWISEWYCSKIDGAINHIVQDRIAKNKDTVPLMEFPKIWKLMIEEITDIITKKQNESKGN